MKSNWDRKKEIKDQKGTLTLKFIYFIYNAIDPFSHVEKLFLMPKISHKYIAFVSIETLYEFIQKITVIFHKENLKFLSMWNLKSRKEI